MPLDALLPQIDDRRYDDIVGEIRTRIARYAPEWRPGESAWTDVNDNDPGITLAQVMAWLAEMLLYRMNKVPALNYIKFLQLIGIELQPAEPAQAELSFAVVEKHAKSLVLVPERTQVSADPGDGGPPLIFETVRALKVLRARLDKVLALDGASYVDLTALNEKAVQGFKPFGPLVQNGAELALGFKDESPAPTPSEPLPETGLPETELDLAVVVKQDALRTQYLQCGFAATPAYPPARLRWEVWNGSGWLALNILKDETLALTRSGHVVIKLPPKDVPQTTKLGQSDSRYWIRARVEKSQYERPPELLAIRANTVAAEQAETIRDEIVGGSDGSRNQRFSLASKPVLKGSLALEIQQSDAGFEPWLEVDDFFGSGPRDNQYVLDRTAGQILTGDGVNGNIPVAYVNNPGANVVARVYRVGGGKRGNVLAGAIKTLVTPITGIDSNAVGNLLAAFSGRDEETIEEAKKRAPRALKSRCRAVTADDFEYLAMQAANVKRAKALPLFHLDFPDTRIPGVVSVIVVPDSDAPNPIPSEGMLRTVCAYLDARRILTTELFVLKPTYQQITVRGEVVVADDADLAAVVAEINQSLIDYFHPLHGGEDGLGWPFGGTIRYSRVYQRVFAIAGVASIEKITITLDGEELPTCTDVPIAANGLLYSTAHAVAVHYSFGAAA
jgi:predicted phage baseplate assembly protein